MGFTLAFLAEMMLRIKLAGLKQHFFGSEWHWSAFDATIVALAILGLVAEFLHLDTDVSSFTLLRTLRLTRLARLIRIFRVSIAGKVREPVGGSRTAVRTGRSHEKPGFVARGASRTGT